VIQTHSKLLTLVAVFGILGGWPAVCSGPRQSAVVQGNDAALEGVRDSKLGAALTTYVNSQGAIAAVCILPTLMPAPPCVAFGQNSDKELSQDIAKLDSFLSERNLDSIEVTVNRESAKWREKDRPSFILYMTKACSLLSSYDIGDLSKRASLLSRYAISVLTSGDLPLHDNVQFVSFLMFDPLVIDGAAWKTLEAKGGILASRSSARRKQCRSDI